ncbi:MAG: hypothetical protein KC550_06385, partial [Nanoarchaeota archaeon]|nr:hypothetical protein [Nanoarchaeota archaeon]
MATDTNSDTIILKYLNENGIVRRKKLIIDMKELHKMSKPTVDRRLEYLGEFNEIEVIEHKDLIKFGIEEKDERASYIISHTILETKQHLDKVFEDFKKSKKDDIKEFCLIEISSHQNYFLLSNQLDYLIEAVDSKNDVLVDTALRLIYDHMKKDILPLDKEKAKVKLRIALKNHAGIQNEHINLRTYIIC